MIISRTKKVVILIAVFIVLGLTTVLATEGKLSRVFDHSNSSDEQLVSSSDYIKTVSPWLESVLADSSVSNIASIREKLLNLRSADQSVGEAHLHLFLGFDAWQKFLTSNDQDLKEQAMDNFSVAVKAWPDLSSYIEKLQLILQNA